VLHCRNGSAALSDPESPYLHVQRTGAAPEARPLSREWPPRRSLAAFLAHLGGGPPPRSSAAEGAAIVATLAQLRMLAGLDAVVPHA